MSVHTKVTVPCPGSNVDDTDSFEFSCGVNGSGNPLTFVRPSRALVVLSKMLDSD